MNSKSIILVCCHKQDSCIKNTGVYKAIQVGRSLTNIDLGFLNDNTGDNISNKNRNYNELTALYWGWKNLKDAEIIGLCHYRRYFSHFNTEEKISKVLKKKEIILIKPIIHNHSNADEFIRLVSFEDFYILIDTLLEKYPDIKQSVIEYFFNSNKWIPCNMFITHKEVLDNYCKFLFNVLSGVELRIKPYNYNRLNRSIGYMGEILLGLYCTYKKLSCCYDDFLVLESNHKMKAIRQFYENRKNAIIFGLKNKTKTIPIYDSVITGLKQDNIILKNI